MNIKTMDLGELQELKRQVEAELADRQGSAAKEFRVAVPMGAESRWKYSKPWIGKVTAWPAGGKTEMKFGTYLGDRLGGELEISARPGDLVRWGRPKRAHNWAVVQEDGQLEELTPAQARKHWDSSHA